MEVIVLRREFVAVHLGFKVAIAKEVGDTNDKYDCSINPSIINFFIGFKAFAVKNA